MVIAARREQALNVDASTTLNESLDNSETVITVTSGAVFPAEGNYRVIIENEVMLVTDRATNDLTVVRGVDGTAAVTHSNGLEIKAVVTASNIIEIIDQADIIGVRSSGGGSHREPYRLLGGKVTLTKADFSWINQNSATIIDDPWGGLTVTIPETTGDWKHLYRTAPTPPYTITGNFQFGAGAKRDTADSGSLMAAGWRESSTGKFVIGAIESRDDCNMWRFTDPATFSANASTNVEILFHGDEFWWQIEDNNTNLIYRVSTDGLTWFQVGLDGRTAFMAGGPNQIMWAFNPRSRANNTVSLRSWIEPE